MNALAPIQASKVDAYRASTDAANICRDIVLATATVIQGRKYVCVEGWQAIAIAHGCTAGARDVERVDGGVKATGEIRRMSDGAIISIAEGFVGEDEPTWFGGQSRGKTLPKRADYAIRAMAQTRAISRACRSAFAHVVVMMNAGLQTTPAEEVPFDGFDNEPRTVEHQAKPEAKSAKVAHITDTQRGDLTALATSKGIDAREICKRGGFRSIPEIPADRFEEVKAWVARQKPKPATVESHASDVLDDEIPY